MTLFSTPLLHDRVALITGGSRGIGAAVARTFAAHGAKLVLAGRTETVEETAAAIRSDGHEAQALRGDLTDEEHVRSLVVGCRKLYGRLDVLVNNAGFMAEAPLGMIGNADLDAMYQVNVRAMVQLTQYAVRIMGREAGGSIVNLASVVAARGLEGMAAYSATKGAVVSFTRAIARELAPRGIRANAIAPGFIDTDLTRSLAAPVQARTLASIPFGRLGTPEEVAGCALFLASPMSAYVTGQVVGVDGGMGL